MAGGPGKVPTDVSSVVVDAVANPTRLVLDWRSGPLSFLVKHSRYIVQVHLHFMMSNDIYI